MENNKSLEEKKIDCLYELLEKSEEIQMTNYQNAALKWAIFELESKYCVEE